VASRLLALLLVLALWPALGETVELVVHLADHGDLAHDPAGEHEESPLGDDEHGCSALFHLCASGHAAASMPGLMVVATATLRTAAPRIPAPLDERGCGPRTPPIRPPIA
jgi:hypothetical protein